MQSSDGGGPEAEAGGDGGGGGEGGALIPTVFPPRRPKTYKLKKGQVRACVQQEQGFRGGLAWLGGCLASSVLLSMRICLSCTSVSSCTKYIA